MKYIRKEDLDKVLNTFGGKKLTLETQQEIHDFMVKEKIPICNTYRVGKKLAFTLSKIKLTAKNPDNSPNWANTLSDGSQIVWNRKHQEFYHLESHGVTDCSIFDWLSMFPEVTMSYDLEWLLDNMSNWQFVYTMSRLLNYLAGKFSKFDTYTWL